MLLVYTNLCDVRRVRAAVGWQSRALWRCQHMIGGRHGWSRVLFQWAVSVQRSGPVVCGWEQEVVWRLFWGGGLCVGQRGAWLAGVFVRWKLGFGGAWQGRQRGVQWSTRAEGLWGKSGRRWKVITAFSAGHFVDLDVVDGEDSTAAGAGDTPLQPVIINTSGDRDHLALKTETRKLIGVKDHVL